MHDECLSAVEAGLALAKISGIHMWDTFLIGHGAMSCHNVCDVKGAVRYIELLIPYEDDPRPWVQVNMDFVKARHSMICGNNAEASRYVERGLLLESQATAPSTFCMHRVLYAHVMYCLGKVEKAVEILSQAGSIAERIGSEHFMVMVNFLKARIDFDEGHDDRALAYLRSALPLAREWGSLGSLWDIPQVTAFLCAKALEAGIEVDFVKEIIRRRHLMPDDLPVMLEHWPWPVKIFTLGRFRIEKDDKTVEFSRKTQKKPLDMLKAIVAKGGSQVSVDTVADLLWPDADGDLAMQSCATTLHRLRKHLGYAEALMLLNGFLALDPHFCWVDSHVFIRLMDKMDSLFEKAQTEYEMEQACNLGCCALAVFRGEFLADEEGIPDVISLREYLNARFFRAISRIGECLVACSQWNKALALFEKGLTVDDCSEDCYQGAMVCLEQLGRKSDAMALFEQCRKTLDAKLGIGPSPQTEARGRSLRSQGIM
jgi:DNA-binding SARP family transcriptional activator